MTEANPLITQDTVVFGLLAACLGLVFYTNQLAHPFWKKLYTYIPAVLMCYLLPSFLVSGGIISDAHSNFPP